MLSMLQVLVHAGDELGMDSEILGKLYRGDRVVSGRKGKSDKSYSFRVGASDSRLQVKGDWCGDQLENSCYLVAWDTLPGGCVAGTSGGVPVTKLHTLNLLDNGLQRHGHGLRR